MTPTSEAETAGLVEPVLGLQIPWLSVQEEEVSVCEERVSADCSLYKKLSIAQLLQTIIG